MWRGTGGKRGREGERRKGLRVVRGRRCEGCMERDIRKRSKEKGKVVERLGGEKVWEVWRG